MNRPARLSLRCAALLALLLSFVLCGCEQEDVVKATPVKLTRDTACSLDGMTLADFPGPKAQIQYDQGDPDFFCDTIEMFSVFLKPEQSRHIRAIFVQDMARADWKEPKGYWTDARQAVYVVGSKQTGSMGPTFASFASRTDANTFIAKEGGKPYRFDEITPDMVTLDGGVIKDKQM